LPNSIFPKQIEFPARLLFDPTSANVPFDPAVAFTAGLLPTATGNAHNVHSGNANGINGGGMSGINGAHTAVQRAVQKRERSQANNPHHQIKSNQSLGRPAFLTSSEFSPSDDTFAVFLADDVAEEIYKEVS
jgi:hypothetical protein